MMVNLVKLGRPLQLFGASVRQQIATIKRSRETCIHLNATAIIEQFISK
jgi:hypothetical protein